MARISMSKSRMLAQLVAFADESRSAVGRRLNLSKGSVSRLLDALIAEGNVREGTKFNATRRGRKTASLSVRPDLAYLLGADLEGMAVRVCLMDCQRQVVTSRRQAVDPAWSMPRIVREWTGLIDQVLAASGIARDVIAGLGVGLPGMVRRGTLQSRAYLPPGRWVDFDFGPELTKFGLPATAANNVLCVAEYERRMGAAREASSFLAVLARYGIGAVAYVNGSFVIGDAVLAGELSHMTLDVKGPVCICGRRGCLDVFSSGRTWPQPAQRSGSGWRKQLEDRSRYLGIGAANLVKLFHCPQVLFNGIYNEYESIARPVLAQTFQEYLAPLGLASPEILFGEPVEFKASLGAALRAAEAFLVPHLEQRSGEGRKRRT